MKRKIKLKKKLLSQACIEIDQAKQMNSLHFGNQSSGNGFK